MQERTHFSRRLFKLKCHPSAWEWAGAQEEQKLVTDGIHCSAVRIIIPERISSWNSSAPSLSSEEGWIFMCHSWLGGGGQLGGPSSVSGTKKKGPVMKTREEAELQTFTCSLNSAQRLSNGKPIHSAHQFTQLTSSTAAISPFLSHSLSRDGKTSRHQTLTFRPFFCHV